MEQTQSFLIYVYVITYLIAAFLNIAETDARLWLARQAVGLRQLNVFGAP